MPNEESPENRVRFFRQRQGWSQAELAEQAGISRTAVSAIEGCRLVPSVAAALALARSLGCTVEELFAVQPLAAPGVQWAWPPPGIPWRYWHAEVRGRMLLFPVEALSPAGGVPHDGIFGGEPTIEHDAALARQTLVLACCDPAAGLLATVYQRVTGLRLIVVSRSSQQSLDLLAQGLVHVAGLHLSSPDDEQRNAQAVQAKLGEGHTLQRVCRWQEGLAVGNDSSARSLRSVLNARLRWIGREPGSAAHDCMTQYAPSGLAARRVARDHRGVVDAIRSGWAEVGVCLRLTCEEAGLKFLTLRDEYFDLCYPSRAEHDPRVQGLLRVIHSTDYRRLLANLPGYSLAD